MRRIRPVPVETESERIARVKREEEAVLENKRKIAEALEKEQTARQSHNWEVTRNVSSNGVSMQPMPNFCKDCGLTYEMFIATKSHCQKKDKEDASGDS